jgi:glycosyltransferase involved in cell wall biosynthesis
VSYFILSKLRAVVRRTLPPWLRRRLVDLYLWLERIVLGPVEARFARRPLALADFEPLFAPDAFAGGPIVMVNSGLASGGVERQIVNTLQALGRRTDCTFGLLCLRLGTDPDLDFFLPMLAGFPGFVRNAMSRAQARRILALRSDQALRRIKRSIGWMPFFVQEEVLRLAAEFATIKPAIVHGWQDGSGIPATYAARMVGVPRIMISTRNVRPTNFIWYDPYMYLAHREIAGCPEITLINNSEAGAADYARWLDLPPDRYVVKRNGVDVSTIRRAEPDAVAALRARLGIPSGAPIVGSIYRFNEEKRPLLWTEAAIEVAKRQPDCHFVVFGAGPLQLAAEALAQRHGIGGRFHCPGTIDASTALSLFDVFLLTSKFEGTPNVVIEASLLGVPIVATESGGTRETVDEGVTGFVVEPAEPGLLADRILRVLDDAPWRARVKTEGPVFVTRRFGLERMVDETLVLYGLAPA